MRMLRKRKLKQGYTLLELVLYIGIVGIALTIISSILVQVVISNRKGIITRETQENARLVMERISSEIRWSSVILGMAEDEITLNTRNGQVRFYLSGDQNDRLYIQKGGTEREITSDKVRVSNLDFSKVVSSNGYISVVVDIEIQNRSQVDKGDFQSITNLSSIVSMRK